jgi:cytochrome c oxidase assembly protein subunit 11
MPSQPSTSRARRSGPRFSRNARLAFICLAVFAGMTGAAFAAVPLYRAFCQATGFDGTVSRAENAPGRIIDRTVSVRFDANVRDVPWIFQPEQTSQVLRLGETKIAYYKATNTGSKPITGQAAFNVVPEGAGAYFHKIECFCFTEQTIQPGETVQFPVIYFVDPEFATDPETKGGGEITLSYTFFDLDKAGAKAKKAST